MNTAVAATSDTRPAVAKLRLVALSKSYPPGADGGIGAGVSGIDLTVVSGEIVTIVGRSGCGKTTLLNCVAGLTPYDGGSVEIDGRQIGGPDPNRAVVFQHASLLPWRTAQRNVLYGLELQRQLPKAEMRRRAEWALRLVGLQDASEHYPSQMSGGMQQRVNLARALATSASVLLMDEPFGALDALTKAEMQQELKQITTEAQQTIIFITHDIDEAVYLGDRVVVMGGTPGRIQRVIDVPFPRTRQLELKKTPEFQSICDDLWQLLKSP